MRLLHQYRVGLVNIAPQEPAHHMHCVDALEAWLGSVEDLSECYSFPTALRSVAPRNLDSSMVGPAPDRGRLIRNVAIPSRR